MKPTLILVLIALLPAAAQAAKIHKWVDENGITVYSEIPPPNTATSAVSPPPPPATDAAGAQQALDAQIERLDKAQEAREKLQQEETAAREQTAQRETACEDARHRLSQLETYPRVLVTEADGTARRLSDEELESMRQDMRRQVADICQEK